MKKLTIAFSCLILINSLAFAGSIEQTKPSSKLQTIEQKQKYTTSGSAKVTINRPVNEVFKILTNVNIWPQINKGVTQAITPNNINIKQGVKFKESISSPIAAIKDWTNEWTVSEFKDNKKFVISGLEEFAQVPIYSKITYKFDRKDHQNTEFERKIELTLDEKFIQQASPAEVEALYRFIGSQWEMANHLKHYVEAQSK